MQQTQWFLGIDGGGTKTEALLGFGKKMVWGKAGPSNPHVVGFPQAAKNIHAAIVAAERKLQRRRPYRTVLGIAGMDTPQDIRKLRNAIQRELPKIFVQDFLLVGDIVIALRSGTDARHGAVIIAGTGSNAYAIGPKGIAQAGGRGHRLADEGSGYAQGEDALHAVTQQADGRGPKTLLTPLVLKHFKVRRPDDLVQIVYRPGFGKSDIASLAPVVQAAAMKGDTVARAILAHAADVLGILARTVIRRAGLTTCRFPLVTVGGTFKCPVVLPQRFRAAVRGLAPQVQFVRPKLRPALGAWLMAGGR